ncbi:hypothetical protein BE20_11620 [Sorangium cellulosum]|nr:hypothetical protein BE20_11620 [Sorangium cellulosum]
MEPRVGQRVDREHRLAALDHPLGDPVAELELALADALAIEVPRDRDLEPDLPLPSGGIW